MAALSRAAWLSKVMCASASWKRLRLSAIGFPASAVLALVVSGRVMFQLAVVSSKALSASRGRSSSMARTTIGAEPPRPARIALARSTTIRKRGIAARVSPWNFPTPDDRELVEREGEIGEVVEEAEAGRAPVHPGEQRAIELGLHPVGDLPGKEDRDQHQDAGAATRDRLRRRSESGGPIDSWDDLEVAEHRRKVAPCPVAAPHLSRIPRASRAGLPGARIAIPV